MAQFGGFVISAIGILLLLPSFGSLGVALGLALGALGRLVALLAGIPWILGLALPSLRLQPGELGLLLQQLRRS